VLSSLGAISEAVRLSVTKASEPSQQKNQIKTELVQLFDKQIDFYGKSYRSKHSASEIAEFDKRRERIRALFGELEQLNLHI
jgi:hypothetical protein